MTFLYILLAIVVLLVMVTIHELGHYIVGKILKFKIKEFSIGFGPAIFSKTSKKTGEKFSLRSSLMALTTDREKGNMPTRFRSSLLPA